MYFNPNPLKHTSEVCFPKESNLNDHRDLVFINIIVHEAFTAWKVSKYGVISGPYFPAFGLNTERY